MLRNVTRSLYYKIDANEKQCFRREGFTASLWDGMVAESYSRTKIDTISMREDMCINTPLVAFQSVLCFWMPSNNPRIILPYDLCMEPACYIPRRYRYIMFQQSRYVVTRTPYGQHLFIKLTLTVDLPIDLDDDL